MTGLHDFSAYFRLVRENGRFLTFGFFILFASSFGQTYFIGVFGPSLRTEFGLSHTAWSAIYMVGTLSSALVLPWTGQFIDRIPLQRYAVLVILALAAASAFMAVVPSDIVLVLAIFFLRQTGQGLMSHTGSTAMARYLTRDRGKAIALASLGFAVGESCLPVAAVVLLGTIGWRTTYGLTAFIILVIILPTALWLLRGHAARHEDHLNEQRSRESGNQTDISWSRPEVLRDVRFYMVVPAAVTPSLVGTGLFFHHLAFAELKGWDPIWFTASYWVYAVGSILAMLAIGPLIDRYTAVRTLPTFLLPMAVALIIVWAFDGLWWALPYLFLVGVTSGITYSGITSLWAEVYGTIHLGAIKSLFSSISVFSTALGPISMGYFMDRNVTVETICLVFAGFCMGTTALLFEGLRRYR